jgi:hypothetical protein
MAVFCWNTLARKTLTLKLEHSSGVIFEANGVKRKIFFFAAARVRIDLAFDQRLNAVNAITHNAGHFTFVGSYQFAANHQQAILVAQNMSLYQDVTSFGLGQMVGGFDFGLGSEF